MLTAEQTITCSVCGAAPKGRPRYRKNGEPAFPFRWKKSEDGQPVCRDCQVETDVCNWSYDCRVVEGQSLIDEQMRLAHRYGNALVELERSRRARTDEVLRQHCPDLLATEAGLAEQMQQLEIVRTAIRAANTRSRQKTRGTPEQRVEVAEFRQQIRDLRASRKALREAAFATSMIQQALEVVESWANSEQKRLRASNGLYWGTGCVVEQAARSFRSGAPPRFQAFRGDGHIAVQLQGGLPVEDVLAGQDSRVRLEVRPTGTRFPLARVRLRVGSDDRGGPIWATVEFRLDRPLPPQCQAKWVHLVRRREGTHSRWRLLFAIEAEQGRFAAPDCASAGTVGVDVGWRRIGEELRIAVWLGDDGLADDVVARLNRVGLRALVWQYPDEHFKGGELRLPAMIAYKWHKAEELTGVRTMQFNAVVPVLATWLREHEHPAWLDEQTENLLAWRSQGRLASVVLHWREDRFVGDEDILVTLEEWRKQDRHLCEYATGVRRRAVAYRRYAYRQLAAELRRYYRTVAVEDINWRDEILRLPKAEADTGADQYARLYHRMAAPGELIETLIVKAACPVKVDPVETTLRHHACGNRCDFDAATNLRHRCEHCGREFDQDQNSALNILALGMLEQKDGEDGSRVSQIVSE